MPALIVRLPRGQTRRFELGARPLSVGRSETCDVHLPSEEVSREHAHIWLDDQQRVVVADRRSKNGTRVDAGDMFRDATRFALRSIRIGEYELEVQGAADPRDGKPDVQFSNDPPTTIGEASYFPSSRGLDLNLHRLNLLMNLSDRISGVFERKQLLDQALDACMEALAFDRGLIVLKTGRGDTEHPVTRNIARDSSGAFTVSRTLINRALLGGERAVVNNPVTDFHGNISDSLVRFPICSALCVPILHRSEILGVVYGDRTTQGAAYTNEDVDFLAAIARQVGLGLVNLRMLNRHVEMQKVVEEIRQARAIQRRLLPSDVLEAGRVLLAGYNEPSSEVGGDYFDYFMLDDGCVGFTVADVTGHGLPAALVMANFQAAVQLGMSAGAPLADLGQRLNRLVCRNTASNVFITAVIGRLDPRTGLIEYLNAGHPAPLIIGADGVRLDADGAALPLGIEVDERFVVQHIEQTSSLRALLFYTDGLVEAEGADGVQLGHEPVAEALRRESDASADAILRIALDTVGAHLSGAHNRDDLTLLAVRYA